MKLLHILLGVLLLALPMAAQEGGSPGVPGTEPQGTMEMENSTFFQIQFEHVSPHPLGSGEKGLFTFYNVNAFQLGVVVLILVLFLLVRTSFTTTHTGFLLRVFRGWVHWLRDEVVYSVMGQEEGARFAPFFIYLFFFITFSNMAGLFPGGVTSTATVFVTGPLAVVTLVIMVGGGMRQQGALRFWKTLLPPDLPWWLVPLMALVEGIGLFVKPFALTVRLFANMLAGHLLIASFIGIIFVFAKMFEMGWLSWAVAVPSVAMAVFIYVIEAFVVLLQAYIFTYLSVLFVQMSLHPEH